jgi:hypothetical protein
MARLPNFLPERDTPTIARAGFARNWSTAARLVLMETPSFSVRAAAVPRASREVVPASHGRTVGPRRDAHRRGVDSVTASRQTA